MEIGVVSADMVEAVSGIAAGDTLRCRPGER
jgi:hypothetical protein